MGGTIRSRDAYVYFIENNQATIFKTTLEAKVSDNLIQRNDRISKSILKPGWITSSIKINVCVNIHYE